MENKYYTPEIEEFHVGLECELNLDGKGYKKHIFDKSDFNGLFFYKTIHKNNVRVKYLDQEDIESLGWAERQDEVKYFELGNFRLYWFNSSIISIDKVFKADNGYYSSSQFFRGQIKNKSELKRLMKQLGIGE